MQKFFIVSSGFLVIVFVLSGLLGIVSVKNEIISQPTMSNIKTNQVDTERWREVVQKIKAYQPDVIEDRKKAELAAEQARLAALELQDKTTLDDAKLIGTVLGSPRKAIMVLPNTPEPREISEGGVWLSPWFLKEVHADYIIWQHSETDAAEKQLLFK